jgi:hypothetical protein
MLTRRRSGHRVIAGWTRSRGDRASDAKVCICAARVISACGNNGKLGCRGDQQERRPIWDSSISSRIAVSDG